MQLTETVGGGDTIPIGSSGSAELQLTLAGVSPSGLGGVTVTPYVAIGQSDWCPLGVFRVDSIESPDNYETIVLTCYDALYFADKTDYESSLIFPATLAQVLEELRNKTGITVDPDFVPPGFTIEKEPVGYTCRQMYEFIAGVCCANARMSRTGRLQFAPFTESAAVAIDGDSQYDDGGQLNHNTELQIEGLSITCGDSTWQYSGGNKEAVAVYDASAAQDRSVIMDIYENSDGTYAVEVTGSGAMMDWPDVKSVPWKPYVEKFKSISFGPGVTSVGAHTVNCWPANGALTNIVFSDTIESIGTRAFFYCGYITYVNIGSGVKTIGEGAFSFCSLLTTVAFPQSIEEIGKSAFENCDLLGKTGGISIPSSCKVIGNSAFSYCSGMIRVQFGSGLESIGNSAFSGCEKLTRIDLSQSSALKSIGVYAFRGLTSVSSVSIAGNAVIDSYAFSDCPALKVVQLTGCQEVGQGAFKGCSALPSLTLPSGLLKIGADFIEGTLIEAISVPSSVTSVADGAFDGATALRLIAADTGVYNAYNGVLYKGTDVVRVPEGFASTSLSIKDGTKTTGSAFCRDVVGLKTISFPASITSIGSTSMRGSGVTEINIPKASGSVYGSPWGADGATVNWTGGE